MTKIMRQFKGNATALFALLLLLTAPPPPAYGQSSVTTTIILLRHAEKETTGDDPDLSASGKTRAERLPRVFENVQPDAFYATSFTRTRQTLAPWAAQTGKSIATYDPKDQPAFAQALKKQAGKTLVVAGHSNTIPALVNLLLGTGKYQPLADSVYNQIWVVEIKGVAATHKKMEY
jgi:phosphohistidine phosphatase SixA